MFCENCGGKLEPGAKFCVLCGALVPSPEAVPTAHTTDPNEFIKAVAEVIKAEPVTDPVVASETSKTVPKNKVILMAAAALCVLAVVVGVIILGNAPEAKMNRAIKNGNVKEAYEIYIEELTDKRISAETADALIEATADVYRDYADEKLSQNEVLEKLLPIYNFAYSTMDAMNGQNEDIKCTQQKIEYYIYMINIQDYMTEDDPLQAIHYYQHAITMDETAEEAKQELAKAEENYRGVVLKNAEVYESSGDLDSAANVLTDALKNLPDDTVLMDSLKAIEDKKNEIIEQQKNFEDTLDNGWDYLQTSMLCYGYDVMPSDFFGEGQLPAALEFTSEAKGVISLVIPEVDLNYRASFIYSVSNNRVIIRPDPSGLFPVEDFNGVNFIYLEILPDGSLKLMDYAPYDNADLGFTTWDEIFTRQEQDNYSLPLPTADRPAADTPVSDTPDTSIPVEEPKVSVVGNTYVQSTMLCYGSGVTPGDVLSEDINPPSLEFTSATEGIFNVLNTVEVYKASFKYTIEDNIITIVPDTDGAYPEPSFSGKTALYMEIQQDGSLKVYDYTPYNNVSLGLTEKEDIFSLSK